MIKNIIDAKNKNCPLPLIMLKKALKEHSKGFVLLINNQISRENCERFLAENKIEFDTIDDSENYQILVNNPGHTEIKNPMIEYNQPLSASVDKYVICITSDKMGHGSDELGEILLKAFINNLKEVTPYPAAIIFYNSGAKLLLNNSAVIDSLKTLEQLGVRILVCGVCVEYYNIKESLSTGLISNMHEITEHLTRASHIIYP